MFQQELRRRLHDHKLNPSREFRGPKATGGTMNAMAIRAAKIERFQRLNLNLRVVMFATAMAVITCILLWQIAGEIYLRTFGVEAEAVVTQERYEPRKTKRNVPYQEKILDYEFRTADGTIIRDSLRSEAYNTLGGDKLKIFYALKAGSRIAFVYAAPVRLFKRQRDMPANVMIRSLGALLTGFAAFGLFMLWRYRLR